MALHKCFSRYYRARQITYGCRIIRCSARNNFLCGHRIMAITSAFHADDAGSIATDRSRFFLPACDEGLPGAIRRPTVKHADPKIPPGSPVPGGMPSVCFTVAVNPTLRRGANSMTPCLVVEFQKSARATVADQWLMGRHPIPQHFILACRDGPCSGTCFRSIDGHRFITDHRNRQPHS